MTRSSRLVVESAMQSMEAIHPPRVVSRSQRTATE